MLTRHPYALFWFIAVGLLVDGAATHDRMLTASGTFFMLLWLVVCNRAVRS